MFCDYKVVLEIVNLESKARMRVEPLRHKALLG